MVRAPPTPYRYPPADMRAFFHCGVAATVEQLPQIEALVAVEKVLSHCVARYESFALAPHSVPITFATAATLGSSTADALRPTISSWARINLGARYAHVAGSWGTGLAAAGGPPSIHGGTSPGSVQSPLIEAGEGTPPASTLAVAELLIQPQPPATPTVDMEASQTAAGSAAALGPPHTDTVMEAQEAAC